ncbi:MAG: Glucose,6-bisphosphate synthase [Actinomycetia bacterium]|nr:Glucose,6-bisphosphate synthase [Actinomycetes bacterium]
MAIGAELRARVEAWIADDPDPVDQAELTTLLDHALGDNSLAVAHADDDPLADGDSLADEVMALAAGGSAEEAAQQLEDRFAGRLTFGTAGLRGQIGAGPNRMNRAVVRAATSAVAGWLLDSASPSPGPGDLRVVIGCDARHRSAEFADEAAAVLAAAGISASLLPRPCPTPLAAFAVRHLSAEAGIMITASHNPRTDNGYKLYLRDGAQVIPPADGEIEGRIAALGPLLAVPASGLDDPLITRHGEEVAEAYLDAITAGSPISGRPGQLRVVYTPMHGVGGQLLLQAVGRAGFPKPHVVTIQAQPDPDFPTAAFPNPEEPTALTLALADAKVLDADLMLANDPDGDRLAVAVPEPETRRTQRTIPGTAVPEDGRWRVLTGDQVGALLGAYLLAREGLGSEADPVPLVATTIVSSTLLSKIAARAGARYAATLTGFKWIARAADQQPGTRFAFGYEEAIGYAVGDVVRDKDGIGAAVTFLRLATEAARAGRSVLDLYDALEREHGVHLTSQLSVPIPGIGEVMRQLRADPPASLGGQQVDACIDYAGGAATGLPPSDVLSFRLGRDRVVIRPSGTEPRVKAYFEIVEPVPPGGLIATRLAAQRRLAPLREAVSALLTGMSTIWDQPHR